MLYLVTLIIGQNFCAICVTSNQMGPLKIGASSALESISRIRHVRQLLHSAPRRGSAARADALVARQKQLGYIKLAAQWVLGRI